jgi:hypothetical protein
MADVKDRLLAAISIVIHIQREASLETLLPPELKRHRWNGSDSSATSSLSSLTVTPLTFKQIKLSLVRPEALFPGQILIPFPLP